MDRRGRPPSQVELDFPSAEAAIAYARRQGLDFVVQGFAEAPKTQCPRADKPKPDPDQPAAQVVYPQPCTRRLEWVERTLGARATNDGTDLDRALTNPAAAFDEPERVVHNRQLSPEQKLKILRHWALEAYRTDYGKKRRTTRINISRLDKVIDALIDLEDPEGLVIRGKRIT